MSAAEAVVHGIARETGDHLCGAPSGIGTDDRKPSIEITCPDCLTTCWLCRHTTADNSPTCSECGCMAHYPRWRPGECAVWLASRRALAATPTPRPEGAHDERG